jgi:hypothetical protein
MHNTPTPTPPPPPPPPPPHTHRIQQSPSFGETPNLLVRGRPGTSYATAGCCFCFCMGLRSCPKWFAWSHLPLARPPNRCHANTTAPLAAAAEDGPHRRDEQAAVVVADAAQHPDYCLDESTVVYRLRQLYVAKVAGAILHACAICGADASVLVHGAQPRVAEAARLGLTLLVQLPSLDLAY